MRILGIDPSIRVLGWGIIEESKSGDVCYVASDTVYTNPAESLPVRLSKLMKKLDEIFTHYAPGVIALESSFVGKDPSSALKLNYVQGIVIALAGLKELQLCQVAPAFVKQTVTGNGRAGKDLVRDMIVKVLSQKEIKFSSYDESDALSIAYAALVTSKSPASKESPLL